jgi:hypothetical protein
VGELGVGQPEVLRSWDRFTLLFHSGVKKAHDWVVDQLVDLFRTTNTMKILDAKTGLLTGLLAGKQVWKYPVTLLRDLLWVQITQSYPNRLRFSSLPCPQSPCHDVIDPVFKEGFFPR